MHRMQHNNNIIIIIMDHHSHNHKAVCPCLRGIQSCLLPFHRRKHDHQPPRRRNVGHDAWLEIENRLVRVVVAKRNALLL